MNGKCSVLENFLLNLCSCTYDFFISSFATLHYLMCCIFSDIMQLFTSNCEVKKKFSKCLKYYPSAQAQQEQKRDITSDATCLLVQTNILVVVLFLSAVQDGGGGGWDALLARGLSSNQVLQQLLPILCLCMAVIYGLGDKLCSFVAGIFIPQYHFPFSVALAFGQVSDCDCKECK